METKTQFVIIQPTPFCNINCQYCYLPYRTVKKRIQWDTLSRIFDLLFSSPFVSEKLTIVWHAGEPLALSPSFYTQALQLIDQCNIHQIHVTHSLQTNAMLITQEWCNFFKNHNIRVGVSIDGPKHIHDKNRIDRKGRGTFDQTLRGIALLQENEIPFSVIAVLTKEALASPEEIWGFFTSLQPTRLGFNIEEVEGVHKQSSFQTEEDIHQYQEFFKRILELQFHSPNTIPIREAEFLMNRIRYGSSKIRSQTNVPMRMLNFDCNGNISTFSPELLTMTHPTYGNFIFGNVFEVETLAEILITHKFLRVNQEIQQGVSRCRHTCEYFMLCGGGDPSNKVFENGTFNSTETMTCRLRIKAATNATLEYLKESEKYNTTSNGNEYIVDCLTWESIFAEKYLRGDELLLLE